MVRDSLCEVESAIPTPIRVTDGARLAYRPQGAGGAEAPRTPPAIKEAWLSPYRLPGGKKAPCIGRWALVRLVVRDANPGRLICSDAEMLVRSMRARQLTFNQ